MPRLSEFFGIAVVMHFGDPPPPHSHAEYEGDEVLIDFQALAVYRGTVRRRALGLILEWAAEHQAELRANWERAARREPLVRIPPLE